MPSFCLEQDADAESQQAHVCILFDVGNLTATGTIDTSAALVGVETEHWVIEDVVCVYSEFTAEAFGESEVFRKRHVRGEQVRTTE